MVDISVGIDRALTRAVASLREASVSALGDKARDGQPGPIGTQTIAQLDSGVQYVREATNVMGQHPLFSAGSGRTTHAMLETDIEPDSSVMKSRHLITHSVITTFPPAYRQMLATNIGTVAMHAERALRILHADPDASAAIAAARGGAQALTDGVASSAVHGTYAPIPELDGIGRDLTVEASDQMQDGTATPIVGQEANIRRLTSILTNRSRNVALLTGPAGVGKTATAEGLAQEIVRNPGHPLSGMHIISLNPSELVGTGQNVGNVGGFEQNMLKRFGAVMSRDDTIVFIDEAHTLKGMGLGGKGSNDALNILKPIFGRGEQPAILATTDAEASTFTSDPAFERRLQQVKVKEPSEAQTLDILRARAPRLSVENGGLPISDDALQTATRLGGKLPFSSPDREVKLISEAAATANTTRNLGPTALDEMHAQIVGLQSKIAVLRSSPKQTDRESLAQAQADLADVTAKYDALAGQFRRERTQVDAVLGARQTLVDALNEPVATDDGAAAAHSAKISSSQSAYDDAVAALDRIRGGNEPLVPVELDGPAVVEQAHEMTGISVDDLNAYPGRALAPKRPRIGF